MGSESELKPNGNPESQQTLEDPESNTIESIIEKFGLVFPTTKEFLQHTLFVISEIIGRKIRSLEECLDLKYRELYLVASSTGLFGYYNSGKISFIGKNNSSALLTILNDQVVIELDTDGDGIIDITTTPDHW